MSQLTFLQSVTPNRPVAGLGIKSTGILSC